MKKLFAIVLGLSFSALAHAELVFEQASVRLMPAGQKNTAAFMKITNTADIPVQLMEITSNVSEKTEFHTHIMHGDMMMMKKLDLLIIPPNQSVLLESGGKHLMLLNLKQDWAKSGEIEFILHDTQQKRYSVIAPIEAMRHMQPAENKMQHHNHSMHHDNH